MLFSKITKRLCTMLRDLVDIEAECSDGAEDDASSQDEVGSLQDFIVDGVLLLQISELGADFHTELYRKIEELQADNEALMAPLRHIKDDAERMKEMRKVFTSSKRRQVVRELPELTDVSRSPTIDGALHSILGPGFAMHPHRALHTGGGDQQFHKCAAPFCHRPAVG